MPIDYTQLLNKINPPLDGEDPVKLRVGVVVSLIQAGTATVTLSGVSVPGVPILAGVAAYVGASVQILSYRGSLLIIGTAQGALWVPLYSENTAEVTSIVTSYAAAASNNVGGFFQFPSSGKVRIDWSSEMYGDGAAGQAASFEIREGTTVGSGTIVLAASDDYAVRSYGPDRQQFGSFYRWTGGTANTAYNIRMLYRSTTAGAGTTARFPRRRIEVTSILN